MRGKARAHRRQGCGGRRCTGSRQAGAAKAFEQGSKTYSHAFGIHQPLLQQFPAPAAQITNPPAAAGAFATLAAAQHKQSSSEVKVSMAQPALEALRSTGCLHGAAAGSTSAPTEQPRWRHTTAAVAVRSNGWGGHCRKLYPRPLPGTEPGSGCWRGCFHSPGAQR